jgi:hypothetical protein
VDHGYIGKPFPDGFIALLLGGRSSHSKDKYNSLFYYMMHILYTVLMLLNLFVYTYIYIA